MGIVRENSNRNLNCFVWIKMFRFLEIFSWYFLELYSFSIRTLCINSDRFVKIEFNVNKIVSEIAFLYLKSLQNVIWHSLVNYAPSNPVSAALYRFNVTNSLRPWLLREEQSSWVQVAQRQPVTFTKDSSSPTMPLESFWGSQRFVYLASSAWL